MKVGQKIVCCKSGFWFAEGVCTGNDPVDKEMYTVASVHEHAEYGIFLALVELPFDIFGEPQVFRIIHFRSVDMRVGEAVAAAIVKSCEETLRRDNPETKWM